MTIGKSTLRDSKIGLPLSSVSSSANSSMFFSTRSESFQIRRPRSLAESLCQGPPRSSKARRAASTARSTSAGEASAICVSTSPVAGLMVSKVFAPSTHWPSISNRPRFRFALVAASIIHPHRRAELRSADGQECPSPHKRDLLRLEGCWPLLHVRRQAFLRVLALEQQLLVLAFDGQGRLHRNLPARLHGALDSSDGFRRLVGRAELLGVLHDVFHEAVTLENVVEDAEFLCFFERERVAGDHQLDGLALPHHPREALRAAGAGEYTQVHLRQADLAGVLAR